MAAAKKNATTLIFMDESGFSEAAVFRRTWAPLFQRGAVRTAGVLRFLRHLRRHVRGQVVLIWDALQAHRSSPVRAWIEQERHWLTVERLPAYAPELNPVEGLSAWLKGGCLANVCGDQLAPLIASVRNGARRVRRRNQLLQAFLSKAGLSL